MLRGPHIEGCAPLVYQDADADDADDEGVGGVPDPHTEIL